jgi:hypothetical protein
MDALRGRHKHRPDASRPPGCVGSQHETGHEEGERGDEEDNRPGGLHPHDLRTLRSQRVFPAQSGPAQTRTEQRLPVVENARLVGRVAQADIALKEDEKRTGELVEAISEPSEGERR